MGVEGGGRRRKEAEAVKVEMAEVDAELWRGGVGMMAMVEGGGEGKCRS